MKPPPPPPKGYIVPPHIIDDSLGWPERLFFAGLVVAGLVLAACGLTAAQWGGIVAGGIKLACSSAIQYVPPSDQRLTATVCQGAEVGADVLAQIIQDSAEEAKSMHLIQPQGEVAPQPAALVCRGKPVVGMQASVAATLAQGKLNKRPECQGADAGTEGGR